MQERKPGTEPGFFRAGPGWVCGLRHSNPRTFDGAVLRSSGLVDRIDDGDSCKRDFGLGDEIHSRNEVGDHSLLDLAQDLLKTLRTLGCKMGLLRGLTGRPESSKRI